MAHSRSVHVGDAGLATHRGRSTTWTLTCLSSFALALGSACGSEGRPNELGGPLDNHAQDVDAGLTDPGGPDAGAPGEVGPSDPDGGLSSDAGGPACGDGVLGPSEICDVGLPTTPSCVQLGFDDGVLTCNSSCVWDTSSCSGTESCYDGRDNDGDSAIDCADTEDCAAACSNACFAPLVLPETSQLSGTLFGHPAGSGSSCGGAAASGSEVVYQVNISEDAKFDVTLASELALSVSVRAGCAELLNELDCGGRTRLTLDASAGDSYFIVVNGDIGDDIGAYELELAARQPACGDAIRDSHEACDDGNINDGDGCDPDCGVESSESEPNDAFGSADAFDFQRWTAELSPEGDADYYDIDLVATSSTLVISTLNLGDGACGLNLMDTVVDIFDTNGNGNALLATDDDGGDGDCARAVASGLPPGTYRVRVSAGAGAKPATFPYRLEVEVGVCGDGERSLGEECDDENLASGDGCDGACREEL